MKRAALTVLVFLLATIAFADFKDYDTIPVDAALQREVDRIAGETLAEFAAAGLKEGNLSISLVDLSRDEPVRAVFAGTIPYHPASVVKLFYLVAMHHEIAQGRLVMDGELERAATDMIVDSSNDATAYVVDRMTRTTGGPELHGRAWRRFEQRRNLMNRYFSGLGYDISASGKTWGDGPYGRERQLLGPNLEHRNRITSEAGASLMYEIVRHEIVSPEACDAMMALLRRPVPADKPEKQDTQVVEFTGESLPAGTRLWSKAGWTSQVRHDDAYVELPNGNRYILVVMTRGTAEEKTILPAVGKKVLALFE